MTIAAIIAAVLVGTWNGNWFPSGRAEHRAHPDVEAATVKAVGVMLRESMDAIDPLGTNDIVLCLNEIRGPKMAEELCKAIGRTNLAVAAVSGYRRRDRFDQQQDVIMTSLPVAQAGWSLWKAEKGVRPPRGCAYALVVLEPAVTAAVYAVHLKSNYLAKSDAEKRSNMEKRRISAAQLVEIERPRRGHRSRPVIVAGDFNSDRWRAEFAGEPMFALLESAGFANALETLPPEKRGTHPNKRWGDSALDYIFTRGFSPCGIARIFPSRSLSDHCPVFWLVGGGSDPIGGVRVVE